MVRVDNSHSLNREQDHTMLSYSSAMTSQHESVHGLPSLTTTVGPEYSHFAMIYSNQDGQIAFESSPSIAESGRSIFTPDLQERFAQIVSLRSPAIPSLSGSSMALCPERTRHMSSFSTMSGRTRHRMAWSPMAGNSSAPLIPCDWQVGQNKRQRRSGRRRDLRLPYASVTPDLTCDNMTVPQSGCVIRVDDDRRLRKYYAKAFEAFQQLNCRVIAKAFIKLVEPRKQVNYPYNGRRASSAGSDKRADPELTKPPWWPAGVKHKEPDHLLKGERIKLLVHILRNLSESHDITAAKLRDAGQDVRRSISPPERLQILDEVYSVRHMEERYLRGEISGDVLIPIAQVHISGSEYEADDAGVTDSASRTDSDGWLTESLASSSVSGQETAGPSTSDRSDTTTTPDRSHAAGYASHGPPSFGVNLPHSPCASSTRASSFDGSMTYSPREYPSSAASSVVSQEHPNYTMGITHQPLSQRPCLTNDFLTQPMLAPSPAAAQPPTTSTVLWNPSLHAQAPSFQSPF